MTDPRSEGADDKSSDDTSPPNRERDPRLDLRDVESKWQQRWKQSPPRRGTWKEDPEGEFDADTTPTDVTSSAATESPPPDATSANKHQKPAGEAGGAAAAADLRSSKTRQPLADTPDDHNDSPDAAESSVAPDRDPQSRQKKERLRTRQRKGYYCLDMFPYPTMRGFSVNQLRGIMVTDVIARYQEAKGRHVLRPIGWDSFGVSIEQEAQQRGLTPQQVVHHGIETMRGQLTQFGARIDWDREITTSDPEYYRWTQWIFLKMLERGLAYRQQVPLKWCPNCGMNLANEEVEGGRCLHCKSDVVERSTPQWMLRITDYAERLHQGLRQLKWPRRVKSMQRHWIGRREGYRLTLKLSNEFADGYEECDVFVRRLEWLPAATHLILAPEHPLVDQVVDEIYRDDVEEYREQVLRKSARERLASSGQPEGRRTGAYALNPVTLSEIPVLVSGSVLPDFRFGALLAVPGENPRHRPFAEAFDLAIRACISKRASGRRRKPRRRRGERARQSGRRSGASSQVDAVEEVLVNSGSLTGETRDQAARLIRRDLEARGVLDAHVDYHLRDWIFARQRYWGEPIPVMYDQAGTIVAVPETELPVELPLLDHVPEAEPGHSPLHSIDEFVATELPEAEVLRQALEQIREAEARIRADERRRALRVLEPARDAAATAPQEESQVALIDEEEEEEEEEVRGERPEKKRRRRRRRRRGGSEGEGADDDSAPSNAEAAVSDEDARDSDTRGTGTPERGTSDADTPAAAVSSDSSEGPKPRPSAASVETSAEDQFGAMDDAESDRADSDGDDLEHEQSGDDSDNGEESSADAYSRYSSERAAQREPSTSSDPLPTVEELISQISRVATRETDTMPQWAASCWYYLRYLSPDNSERLFAGSDAKRWLPVDLCVGGIENALLHLLYVRFFSYFLYDLRITREEEPFRKVFNQGRIYRRRPSQEVQRIKTHRGDRIEARTYLKDYGADALRLHLMFLGPPAMDVLWNDGGLRGCKRFLERCLREIERRKNKGRFVSRRGLVEKHRLIRRVTRAIETIRLNKAISAFMEFLNWLCDAETSVEEVDRAALRTFVILLSPFAPHLAAECWEILGGAGSVFDQDWPEYSKELLRPLEVEIGVLVGNHVRDRFVVSTDSSRSELLQQVHAREKVKQALGGRSPVRTIVVADRLVKFLLEHPREKVEEPEVSDLTTDGTAAGPTETAPTQSPEGERGDGAD